MLSAYQLMHDGGGTMRITPASVGPMGLPMAALAASVQPTTAPAPQTAARTEEMAVGFPTTETDFHLPSYEYAQNYQHVRRELTSADTGTVYALRITYARREGGRDVVRGEIMAINGEPTSTVGRNVWLEVREGRTHVLPR